MENPVVRIADGQAGGIPILELLLVSTTVPSQVLPKDLNLPTIATVSIKGDALAVEVRIRPFDCDWRESDDATLPAAAFELPKDQLVRLGLGGCWKSSWSEFPTAIVSIRDPLELEESFDLTFASFDSNNPSYWLKALAKIMREHLDVPIEEVDPNPIGGDEIPF